MNPRYAEDRDMLQFDKRIGILTAGGDCPGLNAVIRGVVKSANISMHAPRSISV